jgi:F-type H+-transporting ATPase subunit gamma
MPSLKDIRTRIKSVKSTQKITRAMKMVAAAKLRKAQLAAEGVRPYADRLKETIWEISELSDVSDHPLLEDWETKNVMVLVLTSDRGLCGGFNSSIIRTTESFVQENADNFDEIALAIIGRKGNDHFSKRDYVVERSYNEVLTAPSMDRARSIGNELIALYLDEGLDSLYVVYNEFVNAATQDITVERLLPVKPEETPDTSEAGVEFVYEPTKEEVLDDVIPLYVSVEIYRAILESLASEMGARMTAMDSATKNAGDLIERLTIQYNRARQAAITKELMEIVSGAEALKG